MTELNFAISLANRILDRPSGDPDDDLAVLARQLLRALSRERALWKMLSPCLDIISSLFEHVGDGLDARAQEIVAKARAAVEAGIARGEAAEAACNYEGSG